MDTQQTKKTPWKERFERLFVPVSINPLIIFRVAFGSALFIWALGMLLSGEVYHQYIEPKFFFHYRYFQWVEPLPEILMYIIFISLTAFAVMIVLGYYFRVSVFAFTLLLFYIVLIDKSSYLSYYYFMLLLLTMLFFSPAHRMFSMDILRKPNLRVDYVPRWCILAFQAQIIAVFYFAGMAKLNSEWLFGGSPVNIWLNELMKGCGWEIGVSAFYKISIFISWVLILYDFLIPQFLFDSKTSTKAYIVVVLVQLLGFILFPVGYFPFLIIFSSLIFLREKLISEMISRVSYFLYDIFQFKAEIFKARGGIMLNYRNKKLFPVLISIFFAVQITFPVVLFLKWGSKKWATTAFQFSWQLFINHKEGDLQAWYYLDDSNTVQHVRLTDYLTEIQKKRMLTDPNLIIQFVEFLNKEHLKQGNQLHVAASLSKNGAQPILLIDPEKSLDEQIAEFPKKKQYE
jgi:hypothetical protein